MGLTLLLVSTLVSQAVAQTCAQLPDGLVSWWSGDGHAEDIAGALHGVLQNGAGFGTGKVLQAFTFDGDDDRVLLSDSGNTLAVPSLTYEM
jgi:hypothetical protein